MIIITIASQLFSKMDRSKEYDDTIEAIRQFRIVYGDRTSIDDDMLTVETIDDLLGDRPSEAEDEIKYDPKREI